MRYTAIAALTASLALLGCKNLQPSPSGSAAAQSGAQQSSSPAPAATGASPANTTTTPAQPSTSATGEAEAKPGQPPVKDASKTSPQPAKASASQTPQPKSSDGTSMPPTRRNPGNAPTGAAGTAADAKGTTQSPANNTPPVAQRPSAAPAPALDLNSLKERLKDTRAIGLFTKLSLKNQVDDLLSQLRAFHAKKSTSSLADLRQRYDLLLLKVLSLLQDGDPPLATAISQSRDSIWGILSDPQQFAKL